MAIVVEEAKISGADPAASSKSVTFTSPGQPASGNKIIGFACRFATINPGNALTWTLPSGMNDVKEHHTAGNIGVEVTEKTASGSSETVTTITPNTSACLALCAINLSGVGTRTTQGVASSGGTAQDGLTITAEGAVATDGSIALASFCRRGKLNGGDTSYTATGWTEVAKAWDGVSPADQAEMVVLKKTVNISDGTVSCVVSGTASDSNHAGCIVIYPPALSAPGSPTNLAAVADGGSEIDLTWDAPASDGGSAITGYKIERETGVGNGWELIVASTGSTATSYSNIGLDAGQEYNYRVSAINAIGTSSPSTADSATTDAATAPDPPTNLAALGESPTTILLTWDAPVDDGGSEITGYKIERESPTGGGFSTLVADTGNAETTYRDTLLSTATEYNYKISAINAEGTSTASSADAATTPGAADNTKLSQIAFALDDDLIPLAGGAVLDQADRQHLMAISRSPLAGSAGTAVIAQQAVWYEQAAASL